MSLLEIIAEDKRVKIYRPQLNNITGDANSTILLCQIIYWRQKMGKPFYKPIAVDGQSESEISFATELGFTKKEIDRAVKNLIKRDLIIYWYQRLEHRSWWDIAQDLEDKLRSCYDSDDLNTRNHSKSQKGISVRSEKYHGEVPKGHFESTENISDTTTYFSLPNIEEIKNLNLPTPFDQIPPSKIQEMFRLCKRYGLKLQEQAQAIKASNVEINNPTNYMFAVLKKGGIAGASELSEKHRVEITKLLNVRRLVEEAQRRGDVPRWARQGPQRTDEKEGDES